METKNDDLYEYEKIDMEAWKFLDYLRKKLEL